MDAEEQYQKTKVIGQGAFGKVYKAKDRTNGK